MVKLIVYTGFQRKLSFGFNLLGSTRDYIYFNVIFEEIEKNSELKEKFINFIYSILCPNRNFNEIEEEITALKVNNLELKFDEVLLENVNFEINSNDGSILKKIKTS